MNNIIDEIVGGTATVSLRPMGENQFLSPRSSSPGWKVRMGLAFIMTPLPNPAIVGLPTATSVQIQDRQSQFENQSTSVTAQKTIIAPFVDPSHEDEQAWVRLNDERIDLITKKYDSGLSYAEEHRLALLEEAMTRHLDVAAPISTLALDELMKEVQRLKSCA